MQRCAANVTTAKQEGMMDAVNIEYGLKEVIRNMFTFLDPLYGRIHSTFQMMSVIRQRH